MKKIKIPTKVARMRFMLTLNLRGYLNVRLLSVDPLLRAGVADQEPVPGLRHPHLRPCGERNQVTVRAEHDDVVGVAVAHHSGLGSSGQAQVGAENVAEPSSETLPMSMYS